jgi:hypothetical protein
VAEEVILLLIANTKFNRVNEQQCVMQVAQVVWKVLVNNHFHLVQEARAWKHLALLFVKQAYLVQEICAAQVGVDLEPLVIFKKQVRFCRLLWLRASKQDRLCWLLLSASEQ